MRIKFLVYVCLLSITFVAANGVLSAPSTRHDAFGRMVHRPRRASQKSDDLNTSNGHNSIVSSMTSAALGAQSASPASSPTRSGSDHQGSSESSSEASRGRSAQGETSSPHPNTDNSSSSLSSDEKSSSPTRSTPSGSTPTRSSPPHSSPTRSETSPPSGDEPVSSDQQPGTVESETDTKRPLSTQPTSSTSPTNSSNGSSSLKLSNLPHASAPIPTSRDPETASRPTSTDRSTSQEPSSIRETTSKPTSSDRSTSQEPSITRGPTSGRGSASNRGPPSSHEPSRSHVPSSNHEPSSSHRPSGHSSKSSNAYSHGRSHSVDSFKGHRTTSASGHNSSSKHTSSSHKSPSRTAKSSGALSSHNKSKSTGSQSSHRTGQSSATSYHSSTWHTGSARSGRSSVHSSRVRSSARRSSPQRSGVTTRRVSMHSTEHPVPTSTRTITVGKQSAYTSNSWRPHTTRRTTMGPRSRSGTFVRNNTARTTSGPYGVFKTNTLVLPTVSLSPNTNGTQTQGAGGDSTIHQIPTLVVPAQAVATPPDGSIKFGIVFRPSMPWTWVVLQRDTTAQIFNYMPPILASVIGADNSSQVVTCKLKEYSDANVSEPRTLYLGFVPRNLSEALRNQVMDTTSQLYTATLDPVPKQLVAQIDPNFDPLMFSSRDDGTHPHTLRDALVGSFSGIGGAAVLCLLMVFFHRRHGKCLPNVKRKSNIDRRATIKSFSGLDHDADVPAVPAHVLEGGPRSGGYYIGDARNQNAQTSPPTASASMLNIDREYPARPEDVPPSPLLEPLAGSPLTEAQRVQAEYWRERGNTASEEPSPEASATALTTNGASSSPAPSPTAARNRASQAYAAGLFLSASL